MRIDFHGTADAGTGRAGTKGTVKRKQMRLDFRQAHMTIRAGKMLAECHRFFGAHAEDMDDAFA